MWSVVLTTSDEDLVVWQSPRVYGVVLTTSDEDLVVWQSPRVYGAVLTTSDEDFGSVAKSRGCVYWWGRWI